MGTDTSMTQAIAPLWTAVAVVAGDELGALELTPDARNRCYELASGFEYARAASERRLRSGHHAPRTYEEEEAHTTAWLRRYWVATDLAEILNVALRGDDHLAEVRQLVESALDGTELKALQANVAP
ncbi:hypothetical protein ABT297_03990 [Dactylosporangium sp. NPDC000555]|uniref:hypothetical protein n=1 Tax=Dactylosporangium sp. NPDC000555 TaxID=3154260 RepID=UPI00333221F2